MTADAALQLQLGATDRIDDHARAVGESWTDNLSSSSNGTSPKPRPSIRMNATLLSSCHGT